MRQRGREGGSSISSSGSSTVVVVVVALYFFSSIRLCNVLSVCCHCGSFFCVRCRNYSSIMYHHKMKKEYKSY